MGETAAFCQQVKTDGECGTKPKKKNKCKKTCDACPAGTLATTPTTAGPSVCQDTETAAFCQQVKTDGECDTKPKKKNKCKKTCDACPAGTLATTPATAGPSVCQD